MQFEEKPKDDYEYGIVFESAEDEVETAAAAYRELVNKKASAGHFDEIEPHERDFSMWTSTPNHTIYVNFPLKIAELLEEFHNRTDDEVSKIARRQYEPAFESDSVPRRMYLGEKALQMADLIRIKYDSEGISQELDNYIVEALSDTESAPEHPIE